MARIRLPNDVFLRKVEDLRAEGVDRKKITTSLSKFFGISMRNAQHRLKQVGEANKLYVDTIHHSAISYAGATTSRSESKSDPSLRDVLTTLMVATDKVMQLTKGLTEVLASQNALLRLVRDGVEDPVDKSRVRNEWHHVQARGDLSRAIEHFVATIYPKKGAAWPVEYEITVRKYKVMVKDYLCKPQWAYFTAQDVITAANWLNSYIAPFSEAKDFYVLKDSVTKSLNELEALKHISTSLSQTA